jgi:hypothetical protein
MKVIRWRAHVLALGAAGLVACSDTPTAPEVERPREDVVSILDGPVAHLAWNDATAIPIGSPARIEFFGRAASSRRTFAFPLPPSPINGDWIAEAVTTWLTEVRSLHAHIAPEPSLARVVQRVERLLAARDPAEVRAVLGPVRDRITDVRSLRRVEPDLTEHTASFRLDGRDVLRVVTNARLATAGPRFNCVDDPTGLEIDPGCPGSDDPAFDPAQIAADMAAMEVEVDGMTSELTSLEGQAGGVPGECEVDRAAFVSASIAFIWATGEAVYYAWRRDIPNTYKYVKVASLAYGLAATTYLKYRECLRGGGRARL